MTRQDELKTIYRSYAQDPAFDGLKSHAGPKLLVPGRGSMRPTLIFVGEAPGATEATTRKPFMGPAGRVFTAMLEHVKLTRSDVFVTNVVKYRPTIGQHVVRNRQPTLDEQTASTPYLWGEVAVFDPGTPVITMGNVAMHAFGFKDRRISQVHGQGWYDANRAYVTLYHPAVAVYDETMMDVMLADMARVRELL